MQILHSSGSQKKIYTKYIILGAILCAIAYFLINNECIIFKSPFAATYAVSIQTNSIERKKVNLHYFHFDTWHYEDVELLWPADDTLKLSYLTGSWLSLLDDAHIMAKKVSVQSAIITNNVAYISFDRNPFSKEQSTYQKLLWVEGLLKTIRENGIKIQAIQFLSHHHPLNDYHLDFSNPWPMSGFLV